jgi:hypothetical protein
MDDKWYRFVPSFRGPKKFIHVQGLKSRPCVCTRDDEEERPRAEEGRKHEEEKRIERERERERETEREERRDCRQEMASLALGLPTAVAAAAEKSAKELGLRSSNGYFRQAWQQQQQQLLSQRMRGGQVPGVSSLALCRAHQQQQQQKKLEPEASFGAGRTVRSVILPLFAAALVG